MRALYVHMTCAASQPYLDALSLWIYDGAAAIARTTPYALARMLTALLGIPGVVRDPYGEFMIEEHPEVEKSMLGTVRAVATLWAPPAWRPADRLVRVGPGRRITITATGSSAMCSWTIALRPSWPHTVCGAAGAPLHCCSRGARWKREKSSAPAST